MVPLMLFKVRSLDIAGCHWATVDEALQDVATLVDLTHSLLEFQKGIPCVFCRLPSHPVLEDSAGALGLTEHFLHECVFIPELIDSRHVLTRSLPHIPCRVDKLIAHFHLSILEPQCHVLKVHGYGTFED